MELSIGADKVSHKMLNFWFTKMCCAINGNHCCLSQNDKDKPFFQMHYTPEF